MNNLNSLILEGVVSDAPVVRENNYGRKESVFQIGVTRVYKDKDGKAKEDKSYFDCICNDIMCDSVAKNATVGKKIRVVGRLKQNRYKDADGKLCAKVVVICEHVEYRVA